MNINIIIANSNGNNFVLMKNVPKNLLTNDKIKNICKDYKTDGLIILDTLDTKKLSMNYYNNDGSWETFCLNGTICCSLILKEEPHSRYKYIKTESTLYAIKVLKNNLVQVELPNPINMKFDESKSCWQKGSEKFSPISIDNFKCYYINSGAKHIVIKSEDDKLFNDDLNLEKILKKIRYNKLFLPDGVNINIYRCKRHNAIQVKTYEKGVEGMMSSCSSGSYACAYHYFHCHGEPSKIKIFNDGGTSEVVFKKQNGKNLFLSKGEIEYKGELDI